MIQCEVTEIDVSKFSDSRCVRKRVGSGHLQVSCSDEVAGEFHLPTVLGEFLEDV
jgi:hypothetical protein